MNSKIKDYEIVDLGIDYFDYFQGFGTSFTPFEHAIVGMGNDSEDAYEDALYMMASNGIDVSIMPEFCDAELGCRTINCAEEDAEDEDYDSLYVYVGIRYNLV